MARHPKDVASLRFLAKALEMRWQAEHKAALLAEARQFCQRALSAEPTNERTKIQLERLRGLK